MYADNTVLYYHHQGFEKALSEHLTEISTMLQENELTLNLAPTDLAPKDRNIHIEYESKPMNI